MIRTTLLALSLTLPTLAEAQPICERFGNCVTAKWRTTGGHLAGGPPAGCPSRLWCGCYAAVRFLGLTPQEAKRRGLWRARAFAKLGRPIARPRIGAFAIYRRGKRGGHVGKITGVINATTIVLLSGNDGGMVRERERSTRGIIAYRIL